MCVFIAFSAAFGVSRSIPGMTRDMCANQSFLVRFLGNEGGCVLYLDMIFGAYL